MPKGSPQTRLDPEVREMILSLLIRTQLSCQDIAAFVGCRIATVDHLKRRYALRPVVRQVRPIKDLADKIPERCPGCGAKVYMPTSGPSHGNVGGGAQFIKHMPTPAEIARETKKMREAHLIELKLRDYGHPGAANTKTAPAPRHVERKPIR